MSHVGNGNWKENGIVTEIVPFGNFPVNIATNTEQAWKDLCEYKGI